MNCKRISLISLILVLSFSIFAMAAEPVNVTILHTNDSHGRITGFVPRGAEAEVGGFARISQLVKDIRQAEENVLLLDGGDTLHGTNYVNMSLGYNAVDLLNQLKYDAMVPGNHDFNYGYEQLLKLVEFSDFKIVSANVEKNGRQLFAPYTIVEKGGYRFAIIGLSTPDTPVMTHPDNVAGLDFVSPVETASNMVEKLEGKADFIIVLSHLGYGFDKMLAQEVPGVDVIVGGHTHTQAQEPVKVNDTIIVQGGEHTLFLGRLDLTIEDGKITGYRGNLIPVDQSVAKRPAVEAVVQVFVDRVNTSLREVVGHTDVDLNGDRQFVRTQETNMGNLVTDVMLANCDADLVLTNGGGIRASISKGDVTVGDIFTVLPFDNTLVVVELTGEQIVAAVEHGLRKYPESNGGFLHVAGMNIVFDPAQPAGSRVVEIKVQGQPLNLTQTYLVATNDFVAAGGDGYGMIKEGKVVYQSGMYLRDLTVDYFQENGSIPAVEGRIITK